MTELSAGPERSRRAPLALYAGFGLFLVVAGYLVAASLTRRQAPTFEPTAIGGDRRPGTIARPDTVTLDGRDAEGWRYLDLDRGAPLAAGDSSGWDLAVRRFRIRSRGPVAALDGVPFPESRSTALALVAAHPGAAAADLGHWYRYSFLSHLLDPAPRLYLLRTDAGVAVLAVVGYYCPGLEAGCVTVRYAVTSPGAP